MHLQNHLLPLALLLCTGCVKNNQPSAPAELYPLPSVSSSITEPHARASVICAHFWDDAIFPATPSDSVSPALEQAMANFIAVASMASETDSVRTGISEMLRKGGTERIMPVAERYLYDPNSPLRSEETFLLFLEAAPDWERTELLKPQVMKNRVGTPAADFPFVDSKGKKGTLRDFIKANGETFVYFFDSECNVCKRLIPRADEVAGDRAVIAVCPEANAADFDKILELFPERWTIVRDLGMIDAEELYVFPALPSAYLIDDSMTVLAKDLPL